MALITTITSKSDSGVLVERTDISRNKNSLFSNLSEFEHDATPGAAETDDDSDAAEEFMAEQDYHPNNCSCADIYEDIVMLGAEKKNRPKKTVRFMLPLVEEEKGQTLVTTIRTPRPRRQRHVTVRKEPKAQASGLFDWGYGNTLWILDILLCV
jgi:hypothetical protein